MSIVVSFPPVGVCGHCGCARVATACSTAEALKCPWCQQRHGSACRMCHRLVHFRGECGWNRGAHTAFALSPHETVLLCPDCAWEWVLLVQACPRRPCVARPAEELARHIRSAQTLTQPGAVELTACVGGSASWAKVRKWLLHTVRDRSCSKDEIFLLCRHKLSQVLMLDFFLPFLSKSCGLSVARGTLPSPPGKVFSSWGRVSG